MIFTSFEFIVFFCLVFLGYHAVRRVHLQNILILLASCVFYAWWSWKFLFLMLGLSLAGYIAGPLVHNGFAKRKRMVLFTFLAAVLICLAFFKYFNFIYLSLGEILAFFGVAAKANEFNIILPIAISFHTFQLMAYVIDVYRDEYPPERNFVDFMAFSFFFPQLIAGPIERASALLTQFNKPRTVTLRHLENGFLLVAYGFFVKLALADSAAAICNSIFVDSQVSGASVVFGTLLFGFQIYFDFMGYSLIAKGTALLLGFELIWNFNLPYWAISPSDFWRRWHVSLSRWLRDYLYISLGGNKGSRLATLRNLFVTMVLGGLWHGASWNFVLWGAWHGLVLAVHRVVVPAAGAPATKAGKAAGWLFTMTCVFIGWFFFRASTMPVWQATTASLGNWEWMPVHAAQLKATLTLSALLYLFEFPQRKGGDALCFLNTGPLAKGMLTGLFAFLALCFHAKIHYSFIYFAF